MSEHTTDELLEWIRERNETVKVSIEKCALSDSDFWFYDEANGEIANKNRSFFRIKGLQRLTNGKVTLEQPIIIQDEIGYLGIIRRKIGGVPHYLMQAKIEPGNINKIQISPTIQATKSNFTQKHGGKKPPYLDYFVNASKYKIIVDQIQSEQSSRFLKKRNRNIIIELDEDIEVRSSHKWMTLPQIRELMKYDNLVNMDTRTVLSCLPAKEAVGGELPEIYQYINNYKMFDESEYRLVPLYSLKKWSMVNNEFVCSEPYSFKVVFCDIEIEGREVRRWTQPLFEATGIATFGLLTREDNGKRQFLVKALPEVGCFDRIELAPTVQREYIHTGADTAADKLFDKKLKNKENVLFDTLLSEEGGRFYHEQNRNVIIEISKDELTELPEGYFWVGYGTLKNLVQINNCLNIQLRNLLSVLEWEK